MINIQSVDLKVDLDLRVKWTLLDLHLSLKKKNRKEKKLRNAKIHRAETARSTYTCRYTRSTMDVEYNAHETPVVNEIWLKTHSIKRLTTLLLQL